MPAAARGTDAAAAEAFVRFYWAMVNYAQESGDLRGLKELASTDCAACRAGVNSLRKVFADGGEFVGGAGAVKITNANFILDDGQRRAVIEFDVTSTEQTVNYPGKSKDQIVPPGTVSLRAVLNPNGQSWLVSYWGER